jgi:hypothetical protein
MPALPSHVHFVVKSFVKVARFAPEFQYMTDDDYYAWMTPHVIEVVQRSDCLVAVDENDHDVIVGFIVYSGDTAAFAYLRKAWRNEQVFKTLRTKTGVRRYSYRSGNWNHARGGLEWAPFFASPR